MAYEKFQWNHADSSWYGPDKDPLDVVDYSVNFSGLLDTDTIASAVVTASGVTVNSFENSDMGVTIWVSGGVVDTTATVTTQIATVGGRTFNREFKINVRNL